MSYNIIVPAYNEADNIVLCVETLHTMYPEATISIATDGSTDDTPALALQLQLRIPNVIAFLSIKRLGKGLAIQKMLSRDKINLIYDCDMAVNPYVLGAMANIATYTDGLVVGRRIASDRSFSRSMSSKVYNKMARLFFKTSIADHQCGCKALSPMATQAAMFCRNNGFFFDTELIVKCNKLGIPIFEYPVMWTEHKTKSSVHTLRDGAKMFKELIRLRFSS
jgi:glycosyltransferase involved in cell wall biosynthesis